MLRKGNGFILYFVVLFLGLPIIGTILYSFSTKWTNTLFPEGLTLKWYIELFANPLFLQSLQRSLGLSAISTFLTLFVMVPTVFIIEMYFQKYQKWLQIIVMLTYSIPGIVLAVALLNTYSGTSLPMIVVVSGSYFLIVLPYMYQGIFNSIQSIPFRTYIEAASILGARFSKTFTTIILPNIFPGVFVAGMLSFSIMFGEFVIINMILGGRYETMQIFLKKMMGSNGHIASAIVSSYFLFLTLASLAMIKVSKLGKLNIKRVNSH